MHQKQRERERSRKLERNDERAVFGGNDLVTLIQLVVDKPPYLEPHGSKGAAWDEIAQRHQGIQVSCRWESPSKQGGSTPEALDNSSCKAIASGLSGSSAGIIILALLEELEHIVEKAKDKTDDQKAKAKVTTGTVTPVTHTSSISSTDADGASTQPSIVTKTTTVMGHAEKRQADASPSEEPKPKCYHESARCPALKLAAKSSCVSSNLENVIVWNCGHHLAGLLFGLQTSCMVIEAPSGQRQNKEGTHVVIYEGLSTSWIISIASTLLPAHLTNCILLGKIKYHYLEF
ncbi:hypothetical protein L208DRAFT_1380143 [Tricholoma matsutake]|nr:hypothetical protein L208DRAFT_1380143 [Tricholoma matsutake 945]